jgi:peroxiredoxin
VTLAWGVIQLVLVAVVAALAAVAVVLVQILRQQGRMQLRLDALDDAIDVAVGDALERAHASDPVQAEAAAPTGIEVGREVPDFELRDLDGAPVSLSTFRGERIALVYWSPDCGYCDQIAPSLVRLQNTLERNWTRLVLVAWGDAASNRELAEEHGLECPILLIEGSPGQNVVEDDVFRHCGTPSAYLIGPDRRVAEPLAIGADQVVNALVDGDGDALDQRTRAGVHKLSIENSKIERTGLTVGTPAPDFSLPDIRTQDEAGEEIRVSLDQFSGRRVLLVFSDPQCGPCDNLAPELVRLHTEHGDRKVAIVMVTRGNADDNRRKLEEHGFPFPVLLQHRWRVSREYGIFATPVAFLIDGDGILISDVAMGMDPILKLARKGLTSPVETKWTNFSITSPAS